MTKKTKQDIEAFKNEIIGVCQKFDLSLSHEDTQGNFIITDYKEENIKWFSQSECELGVESMIEDLENMGVDKTISEAVAISLVCEKGWEKK